MLVDTGATFETRWGRFQTQLGISAPNPFEGRRAAPAQEFRHPTADREMQQPAHADSGDTAQYAAGSGSTAWRTFAR